MKAAIEVEQICKIYGDTEVLSDISFKVGQGETVGIIGPNGAGKSTLLKILSGIVRPTSGRAVLNGSVASILEIGMGFHPELTGSENIFFAGQMMGHSKKEIEQKFQKVVEFSELKEHMDKAVKFYSSGMYLRLAFAVFALLDTEILILDEVLSVGDAAFKRKSFEWMSGYKLNGKTILLVSHNLNEVENFCDRVIYVDRSVKMNDSSSRKVIRRYLKDHPMKPKVVDPTWLTAPDTANTELLEKGEWVQLPPNEHFNFFETALVGPDGKPQNKFLYDDEVRIRIRYERNSNLGKLEFVWQVYDMNDTQLLAMSPMFTDDQEIDEPKNTGKCVEETIVPRRFFNIGKYHLTLLIALDHTPFNTHHRLLSFDVDQSDWMAHEPWSDIACPILHSFSWNKHYEQ